MISKDIAIRDFLCDHFGMFIHWGLYSVLAGEWKGKRLERNDLGEWIMLHLQIPLDEYKKLVKSFHPTLDFADKWVIAAKKAGIRYIVITTMHHDGFCLFRSDVNDYNAYDTFGRDLIGELAEACHRYEIKLGLYYSHTLDWSEPNAPGNMHVSGTVAKNGNTWDFPDDDKKDYSKFLYGKVFPQVKELLTHYGDVLLMWFDYPHNITPEQSIELYDLVKSIQPRCLVNSRIGNILSDYYDLGDNQIPTVPMGIPQECLVTLNDSWGYKQNDHNWKKPEHIIDMLIRSASCGSNLLMNVGPRSDGNLPSETIDIMNDVSDWVSRNNEAIYDTHCSPFKATFNWGYITQKENRLYLYLKVSDAQTLEINGLENDVVMITAVIGGEVIPFEQRDDQLGYRSLRIRVPASCYNLPVYCVFCKSDISTDSRILQHGEMLSLYPLWAQKYRQEYNGNIATIMRVENNTFDKDNGKCGLAINRVGIASGWKSKDEYLQWEALVTDAGMYELSLISLPGNHIGNDKCGITLDIIGPTGVRQVIATDVLAESFRYQLSQTGIDNMRIGLSCGKIHVTQAGMHRIQLHRNLTREILLPLVCLQLKRLPYE